MLIICTGATGLVGYNFVRAAADAGHKVIAVCGSKTLPEIQGVESLSMDLTDEAKLQRLLLDVFPQAVVNCAAISSPVDVDANPTLAAKMNSELPERLALLSHHVNARFVHLSTDMVFDGTSAPYKNTDIPNPTTLYGQTKLLAEKRVLKIAAPTSVVLRLSHVSGNSLTTKRSLHEKLLRTWASGQKSKLRTDEIKCPLSASRLATLICEIIERENLSGIYHYAGLESISRYDMGRRIAEKFGLSAEEFIEPITGEHKVDLTMDVSALLSRVKERSCMFDELLEEMVLPSDLNDWIRSKTGKVPIKRFKL